MAVLLEVSDTRFLAPQVHDDTFSPSFNPVQMAWVAGRGPASHVLARDSELLVLSQLDALRLAEEERTCAHRIKASCGEGKAAALLTKRRS